MWRISLPTEKRSSYLSGYMSRVAQWMPRHKYLLLITTFLATLMVISALAIVQYAVAQIQQKETAIEAGTQSVSTSSATQQAENESEQQVNVSASPTQTTPDNPAFINHEHGANATMDVRVNGRTIPVPQNGSVNTTVPTGNGSANVSVNVEAHSSDLATSSSSSFVHVNSHSSHSQISIEHSP